MNGRIVERKKEKRKKEIKKEGKKESAQRCKLWVVCHRDFSLPLRRRWKEDKQDNAKRAYTQMDGQTDRRSGYGG